MQFYLTVEIVLGIDSNQTEAIGKPNICYAIGNFKLFVFTKPII